MLNGACATLVAMLSWAATNAAAQNVSSSLLGTLTDSTASAIAGANVELLDESTGAALTVQTNTAGLFRFPTLLAGRYTLKVSTNGFKSYNQTGIELASSETRDLGRISLALGLVRESISVSASATPVQTASSEKSALVTGQELNSITLKGRDLLGLLPTLPGIVDDGSQSRDATSYLALSGLYIAGGRNTAKNYTVDGVTALDIGSNSGIHYEPNMDAVAEVRVLVSNYQAEFGRSGGGSISLVTKSGTRDFHGSGWWTHRNEGFNANNYFNNRAGIPISPYRLNVAGFSIGGPVYIPRRFNTDKKRLFFFLSQEYTRQKANLGSAFRNMPTALERAGDYSQSFDTGGKLIPVIDPLAGTPFPGNIIPSNRINPVGASMLNFFPLPNYRPPQAQLIYNENYAVSESGAHPRRNDVARSDLYFTDKLTGYFRYIRDIDDSLTNLNLTNYAGPWIDHSIPGRGYSAHVVYTVSPSLFDEFSFGQTFHPNSWQVVDPSQVDRGLFPGVPSLYQVNPSKPNMGNYIPSVGFGGAPVNPPSINASLTPYYNVDGARSFNDNLSKVIGGHSLKAGIYIERPWKTQPQDTRNYLGNYNFASDANNPFDSRDAFANALLGNFDTFTQASDRLLMHLPFWDVEWYVQDNWRVNSRLTIDIGMRFYHVTPAGDTNHNIAGFNPSVYSSAQAPVLYAPGKNAAGQRVAVNPINGAIQPQAYIGLYVPGTGNPANGMQVGGVNGVPAGIIKTDPVNFGPRFGFAYDLFGNGKTAIRGGIGAFHDTAALQATLNMAGNPPLTYAPTVYYGTINNLAQSAGALGPTNVTFVDGNQHMERTVSYSLGVQHQLGFGTVLDVSYVGNFSRHLLWDRNINEIPMFSQFSPANQDPTSPGKPLPNNFFRPYPGWGDLTVNEFAGTANYNSLQISVNRRFAKGLLVGFSYTFSKALGEASTDQALISSYFSPRSWNYGPLNFNRTQVAALTYSYELPKFRPAGGRFASAVVNGWTISGVTSFATGAPFTPGFSTTSAVNTTGSAESARITVVGDPNNLPSSQRTVYNTFNTAAFALTPVGSFGNAGVNILTGPGVYNFDIAMGKKFSLGRVESRSLQFRVEAYNVFNHTQFSSVDAGASYSLTGVQTNADFGAYNAARAARLLSFSLRFVF